MENKGTYKRYAGKITVESPDGMVVSHIVKGLVEGGIDITSKPIFDDEGRFIGETMELYEIVRR